MAQPTPDIDEIYLAALELPADKRSAYLDVACANHESRRRVERLLQAAPLAGSFLERPAQELEFTVAQSPFETVGAKVGPYKLLEQIGEGGMGIVFMAEQTEPIRRKAALKVIKPGMDTKQVVARFEAERQALAIMDHPNIAKVLDGGATDSGRPYFVMELVKGRPITQYCDEQRLTPRQRLELFLPVCQAIQHAHQKGIIHRDIKPSNILVAEFDQQPVPKVIDFGVAKATSQPLTEKSMFTGFGQVVGTFDYMSPEQAKVNQLDIDTRSDIYSLGVLLYELLTGSTPFDKQRLRSAAWDEMLRIIREEETPTLSNRLRTTEELPAIASNRGIEAAKLARLVRGELDWIVMKALEKDRDRRYDSASALAADVARYLADEPVLARPPSAAYRLRKLARRHRSGLAMAGVVLFFTALLGNLAGWAWRDRAARIAEQEYELNHAIERAESLHREGKRGEAQAALEQSRLLARTAEPAPALAERIESLRKRLDAEGRDEAFIVRFEAIRQEVQTEVDVEKSVFEQAKGYPKLRTALEEFGVPFGDVAPADAASHIQGRPAAVQALVVVALDECLRLAPKDDAQTRQWLFDVLLQADGDGWRNQVRQSWARPETLQSLVRGLDVRRQPPSFLALVAMALPIQSQERWNLVRSVQFAYPGDFWANHQLAFDLNRAGKHAEAVRYYTAALGLRADNPGVLVNRAQALVGAGELEAASLDLRRAVAVAPRYAVAHCQLGYVLGQLGKLDEASTDYQEAIRLEPDNVQAHHAFGCFLRNAKGDYPGAVACFRKALELDPNDVQLHIELSDALRRQQLLNDAIDVCHSALKLDPGNVNLHAELALCLRRHGKLNESVDSYRKALELDSSRANLHVELGYSLGLLGKPDEAVAAYQEGIRLQPNDAYLRHAFACFLRDLKRDQAAAIDSFHAAIRLDPNNFQIQFDFGHSLRRHRMLDEAAAAFREALRLKPGNGGAREALASTLNQLAWNLASDPEPSRRNPVRAVSLAKEAIELAPRKGDYHDTLGAALYRSGEWQAALDALKKAEELSGGQPTTSAYFIAMAHWRLDDKAEARRQYDRAAEWMNKNEPWNLEQLRFRTEAAELLELMGMK